MNMGDAPQKPVPLLSRSGSAWTKVETTAASGVLAHGDVDR